MIATFAMVVPSGQLKADIPGQISRSTISAWTTSVPSTVDATLDVPEMAGDLVLQEQAVAAECRSRASATTARARAALCIFARLAIAGVTFPAAELRQAGADEPRRRDVGEHLREPVLGELVAAQRRAKALAPEGVRDGGLVGGDGVAEAPLATPGRAAVSTRAAAAKSSPPAGGSRPGRGRRRRLPSACHEARLAILPAISRASTPGVPFSTT